MALTPAQKLAIELFIRHEQEWAASLGQARPLYPGVEHRAPHMPGRAVYLYGKTIGAGTVKALVKRRRLIYFSVPSSTYGIETRYVVSSLTWREFTGEERQPFAIDQPSVGTHILIQSSATGRLYRVTKWKPDRVLRKVWYTAYCPVTNQRFTIDASQFDLYDADQEKVF